MQLWRKSVSIMLLIKKKSVSIENTLPFTKFTNSSLNTTIIGIGMLELPQKVQKQVFDLQCNELT